MLHLCAYSASIAQNVYADVAAIQDDILTIVNNHFQLFDQLWCFAGWAGGVTLDRVRFASATFRQINQPFLVPIENAVKPASYPRLVPMIDAPIRMPMGEEIAMEAFQTSAGAEREAILLWLGKDLQSPPAGDLVTARFTSTVAAVANLWTSAAYAFDSALPSGIYAIINSYVQSANGIAHRWIIPNQVSRPGFLSRQVAADIPHPLFANHRFGEVGRFANTTLPIMQVLCSAADAAHTGYMQLIKVG